MTDNVLEFKKKEEKMEFPTVYSWWKFDKALTDEQIDKIMQIGEGDWKNASIGGVGDRRIENKVRKTDIIWNNEQWVYDLFWPYMETATRNANWNLQVDCAESFQLGKYEDGGRYDYHIDGNMMDIPNDIENDSIMYGKTRKISMVCWLNEDFVGGAFEFHKSVTKEDAKIRPTKGTIVFFPSYYAHKVHPVTKGTRYSLVTWFNGQPIH